MGLVQDWRLILLLSIAAGCGSPESPSRMVPTGAWGGDHISLAVSNAGAHVEFDCAHGDIPGTLTRNGDGAFTAEGTFVREHGGPIRIDEVPDTRPAVYAGVIADSIMRLTIRLRAGDELIGTYTLTYGSTGRVLKCL